MFLKLGGSLITDKNQEATARPDIIRRLAQEVKGALSARPDLRLLIGHGSGSFGHYAAERYQIHRGCTDWRGYAETGAAAARLNRLVADIFLTEGVPVVSLQPSASARCARGTLLEIAVAPIQGLLARCLVPMVYGDVALDEVQGSAIVSTEQLFVYLGQLLSPSRIILAGEVDGVFTADPTLDPTANLISEISPRNIEEVKAMLAGSHGVDVTGGMLSKVMTIYQLFEDGSRLTVALVSGLRPGCVRLALEEMRLEPGTLLHW